MEVTQIAHQNTHAIIGGQAPESFGVEDNAEFYEMLSSTLYPNKKLAVVREVLCNSWDAHLMVGKTDVPVEVTITEKEMSFKDFGPGIGRDQIIKIYCTYGKSTKSHDGKQTGGFGLGSKSPFAYSKHFTVVSCIDGKRTIYAASRGSSETNGKPDFRAMASDIPTEETGITVTIPLLDARDRSAFEELVRDIARFGGMNVKLNGQLLPTIRYEKADWPFVLVAGGRMSRHHGRESGLYVRYGAVVYPVDTNNEEITAALHGSSVLATLTGHYGVILLAKPNTIGVAPSRETLSYTNKTVETVVGLIKDSDALLGDSRQKMAKHALRAICASVVKNSRDILGRFRGLVERRSDIYSYAQRQVYHGVWQPDVAAPALSEHDIIKAATLSLLCRGGKVQVRQALNNMDSNVLFQHIKNHLRRTNPNWKRYFGQIEAAFTGRRHDDHVGKVSLRHDVMGSLARIESALSEPLKIRFSYGHFSWDDYSEITEGNFATKIINQMKEDGKAHPRRFASVVDVIFAPSRAAAMRFKKSQGRTRDRDRPVLLALTRAASDVETAMECFERYGFNVSDAREHVKKREALAPSGQLHLLRDITVATEKKLAKPVDAPDLGESYTEASDAKFYCYGAHVKNRHGENIEAQLRSSAHRWVNTHVGDCVVALNATDARLLGKKGLRNIHELLAEEIIALSQTEAGAAALLVETRLVAEEFSVFKDLGLLRENDCRLTEELISPLGHSVAARSKLTQREKDLIALVKDFHNAVGTSSGGKFGSQHVINAMKQASVNVSARYERIFKVLGSDAFKGFYSTINTYYLNRMNSAVLFAAISGAIQAAAVQVALESKTK